MSKTEHGRRIHNKMDQEYYEKKKLLASKKLYVIGWCFLIIVIVGLFIYTGNPLFLMGAWFVLFNIICENNVHNLKCFKKLLYIPVLEFCVGIVLLLVVFSIEMEYAMEDILTLVTLVLIFCSFLNGIMYYIYWRKR